MNSSKFSLFFVQKRAFKVFNKESKQDSYSTKKLLKKCFAFTNNDLEDKIARDPIYDAFKYLQSLKRLKISKY